MSELICCNGVELEADVGTAVLLITPSASKVKTDGNSVYFGSIDFTVSSYTNESTGFVATSPMTGSIKGLSKSVKSSGNPAVLESDESSQITLAGTIGTTAKTQTIKVKVKSPGQSKVKAK